MILYYTKTSSSESSWGRLPRLIMPCGSPTRRTLGMFLVAVRAYGPSGDGRGHSGFGGELAWRPLYSSPDHPYFPEHSRGGKHRPCLHRRHHWKPALNPAVVAQRMFTSMTLFPSWPSFFMLAGGLMGAGHLPPTGEAGVGHGGGYREVWGLLPFGQRLLRRHKRVNRNRGGHWRHHGPSMIEKGYPPAFAASIAAAGGRAW